MLSNLNESTVLSVLRTFMPAAKPAHPTLAGLLSVQGNACGGWVTRPRSTQFDLSAPEAIGAYGIGVSVAKGIVTTAAAPADAQPSGVPPRGRPV